MKSRARPTPPHRHPSGSWGPATFAPTSKALGPSFRWDDDVLTSPHKDTHA